MPTSRPSNLLPGHFRRAKSVLMRRGTRPEDAEDLIQEAFIKMQRYCEKGGQVRQPERFLMRTAVRLAANARRDAHPELYAHTQIEELTLVIDTSPRPDEVLAAEQCLLRMRAALDELQPRTRAVFFMHRFDDLTQPQIADRLGISVSAVEKHIAIALAALTDANLPQE